MIQMDRSVVRCVSVEMDGRMDGGSGQYSNHQLVSWFPHHWSINVDRSIECLQIVMIDIYAK